MTLKEIKEAIESLVDPETGEVKGPAELGLLEVAFDDKAEATALVIKEINHMIEAIKEEEATLAKRRRVKERKAEWLENYLADMLGGNNFETAKVDVRFRKTSRLSVQDEQEAMYFLENQGCDDLLKFTPPKINKANLKRAVKAGLKVPGVAIEEHQSMKIM